MRSKTHLDRQRTAVVWLSIITITIVIITNSDKYNEQHPPGETEDRGRDRVVLRGLLAPKLSMALFCFFGLPATTTRK